MSETEIPILSAKCKGRPLMVMEMADHEARTAGGDDARRRMERCAELAHWQLLSFHKGRVVKQLGSGLLMEFANARSCLQAAFSLRQLAHSRAGSTQRLHMRAAAHLANVEPSQHDFLTSDVTLTSALAALAQPGELLVTAELRDLLTDGLDADFEDLGRRRVGSSDEPLRLFRARRVRTDALDWHRVAHGDHRAGLAIIPFQGGVSEAKHWLLGELIAEGVIARLSHSIGLRVISRQSTSALRDGRGLAEIERELGAAFVLSGSYRVVGKKLIVDAELAESRSHTLLWSGQLHQTVGDLLQQDSQLLQELAQGVAQALGGVQVRKVAAQPPPRLDSHALLLAGTSMIRRQHGGGHQALTELTLRHPRLALPRAWLGMWHALKVVMGESADVRDDTAQAREQLLRALDVEPGNSIALAVDGYIQCQLLGNPQQAGKSLNAAIEANPSEPMAWLFKGFYSGMWASTSAGVAEVYLARALSPVDPLRYFFDLLTGNALCADGRHEEAIAYAQRSLRANRNHVPTLRLLLTAQAELARMEEGKETVGKLLAEAPGLTVASYLSMGSADSPMRQRIAAAMRVLGVPEG